MLYEYVCNECGFVDSFFHKMEEKPIYKCPECGREMRKALGLNYTLNGYSYKNSGAHNVRKITQQVIGVPADKINQVDSKLKKAPRAKPIPTV